MSFLKKIWHFFFFGTYGMITLSNMLICVFSGIFLAIPYHPSHAYDSVTEILLFNPPASFVRNIHYWSAQFVLIFTLLHIWQHFRENSEKRMKKGIWFRLVLTFFVVFYLMISGFILKGDADSLQAQRILNSLLNVIPFFNFGISDFLTGKAGQFDLIYVQHIATATVILLVFVFEHARTFWGKTDVFVICLIYVILFSIFLTAPLHDGHHPVLKGPWYFTGMQELLHLSRNPVWVLWFIFFLTLIFYLLPRLNQKLNLSAKRLIYAVFFIYVLFTISGFYFRGENWRLIFPWQKNYLREIYFPAINIINPFNKAKFTEIQDATKKESCLICHGKMEGFSPSHPPEAIGCASCHLGNIFSLNKKQAHAGMISIPGNLETADLTCGTADCHPDITRRIKTGLMTTLSGIISVDRYAFGEYRHPDILSHITGIKNSQADIHLKNLCTQCHLGRPKTSYGILTNEHTGGGCLACHLNYTEKNLTELSEYQGKIQLKEGHLTKQHPSLSIETDNAKCFACHSRSGRISLSYEGWYETHLTENEINPINSKEYKVLWDGRVLQFLGADVHHEKGLACIDCHNSYELMGDGTFHIHKEEQVQISCQDCHSFPPYKTISASKIDRESALIASLRTFSQKEFLLTAKSGRPLINSYTNGKDSAFLQSKLSGKKYYLKPPSGACSNQAHQHLSCESCHTPRVARCIGCHNEFNPDVKGIDNLSGKKTKGSWIEYGGEFVTGVPTLGVEQSGKTKKIVPLMPGMVMSMTKLNSKDSFFKRLYAPAYSHNTIRPAMNCKNCHLNPISYGYGKGEFVFTKNAEYLKVEFVPYYVSSHFDQLPADALIPFRKAAEKQSITRNFIRPFTSDEQEKILLAGSCLTCHEENSAVMNESLTNFEKVLARRSKKCLNIK
ncbi:MAG TPA: hypothetical protein P5050_00845 [Bacteroidia bacterium]|nr:hypothetical protein [Bacteroidia bacterium]HRS57748.1 hypothetical protein [Bacteroidia bacterium]